VAAVSRLKTFALIASLLLGCALGTVAAAPCRAALGGDVESVRRDHAALQAAEVVSPTVLYDVHESRSADGLQIREYVDRVAGKVFAVTWQGPRSPDVSALLGDYAARYAAASQEHRGSHHVLSIDAPDLAVTIVRLPRGWAGQAYLPAAIPEGVDRAELR
jgi:hypothetical protein